MIKLCYTLTMTRTLLTAALLLVSGLVNGAAAGDDLNKIKASKKAKAVSLYLEKLGFNDSRVKRLTNELNERLEGDYLRLGEEKFEYGRVVLFFEVEPRVTSKQIQLKFQPDNSNFEYTASTRGLMVNYRYEF